MPVKYDVVALGNAIMDVIAQVDDDFLVKHDIPKARTNLISPERCELSLQCPAGQPCRNERRVGREHGGGPAQPWRQRGISGQGGG
jgi:sugar/nucleoside kinase (ribokinase family)